MKPWTDWPMMAVSTIGKAAMTQWLLSHYGAEVMAALTLGLVAWAVRRIRRKPVHPHDLEPISYDWLAQHRRRREV